MDHVLVDAIQLEALGLHVVDEPYRIIDPGEGVDHGGAQGQGFLDLLVPAHLVVHVLEAGHDAGLAVADVQLGEFQPVVAEAGLKHAPVQHGIDQPALRIFDDALRRDRVQEPLAVLLQHQFGIEGEGLGEFFDGHGHLGGHEMDHIPVDAHQLEALGLHVVDQPEGIVDPGQGLDDGGAQGEGLLKRLILAHLLVHVLEAGHDAGLAVGQVQLGEFQAVVPDPAFKDPAEGHGVDRLAPGVFDDVVHGDRVQKLLPVVFQHQLGIEGEGLGESGDLHGHVGGHEVDHVLVDAVQLEPLGLHVVDEPHRVVGSREGLDDGGAQGLVGFRLPVLVGDVRHEHVIQPLIDVGFHIVAVVVHPAHLAVPADDAVFHVILVVAALVDLLLDGGGHLAVILGMHHAPEGEAGQGLEVLQGVAAVYFTDGPVGVQQRLALVRPVDEEAAGHVPAQLFDDRKALFV